MNNVKSKRKKFMPCTHCGLITSKLDAFGRCEKCASVVAGRVKRPVRDVWNTRGHWFSPEVEEELNRE